MDAAERALLAETVRDAIAGRTRRPRAQTRRLDTRPLRPRMARHARRRARRRRRHRVRRAGHAPTAAATVLDDVVASHAGMRAARRPRGAPPPLRHVGPPGRTKATTSTRSGPRAPTAGEMLVVVPRRDGAVRRDRPDGGHGGHRGARGSIPTAASTVRVRAPLVAALDAGRAVGVGGRAAAAHRSRTRSRERAGRCSTSRARTPRTGAVRPSRRTVPGRAPPAGRGARRGRGARVDPRPRPAIAAPDTAALAKAIAGRTARTVAAHCQQVLAGIGFTTDHPFHGFLKRTMHARRALRVGRRDRACDVGRQLLASRTVPTLIEL